MNIEDQWFQHTANEWAVQKATAEQFRLGDQRVYQMATRWVDYNTNKYAYLRGITIESAIAEMKQRVGQ